MTSEVRSSGARPVRFLVNNFAQNGRRAAILSASCFAISGASNGILFVRVRVSYGVDLGSRSGQVPSGHDLDQKRLCCISFDSAGLPESIRDFCDSLTQFDRELLTKNSYHLRYLIHPLFGSSQNRMG